ncbi:unnamed protein product [Lactuca virosa]|uniref:Uncharacterized protein n=1 Tax=Lactuca virosa TaxID=75947 RepID=A0AAU9PJS2_9ASTR|nr:unnamed protein product [Lactuca virosa]
MAKSSSKSKEKFVDVKYVPNEDSDDDLLDMSYLDCEPETFKPQSIMPDDPFLNMLCKENIFKNTYEDIREENQLDARQEAVNEHIGEDSELDVDVEYKVHDPTIK